MLSNNQSDLDRVREYREAAIADGWECSPLYRTEDMDRASRLTRDGFVMHVITRDQRGTGSKFGFDVSLAAWGLDGLSIKLPRPYPGMDAIVDASKRCHNCGGPGGTERYSFAGRCCAACLPEMRKRHEYPGWNN